MNPLKNPLPLDTFRLGLSHGGIPLRFGRRLDRRPTHDVLVTDAGGKQPRYPAGHPWTRVLDYFLFASSATCPVSHSSLGFSAEV